MLVFSPEWLACVSGSVTCGDESRVCLARTKPLFCCLDALWAPKYFLAWSYECTISWAPNLAQTWQCLRGKKTPPIPALITPGSYFYPTLASDQAVSPLFSKLPALKSFARVSGRSTAAISHRGGLSTAGVPGWEQSIAAECGLHCCLSLHTGSCADRHPLCLPAFPPVTAIPASPPAAGGKALALFALPGVFLHPSASLLGGFPCRRDADPAQAGQPQPLPALPPPFPVPERHFLSFLSHTQVSGSINI